METAMPPVPLLLVLGCTSSEPAAPPPPPPAPPALEVRATSFPADWLVRQVVGRNENVNIENIHPRGEDPPAWSPPGSVVAGLAEADLIVANGAGYEAWMATASLPEDKVVYTAAKIDLIQVEGTTHSHGAAGEHSHAGPDPHTWSDPTGFFAQARAVHAALVVAAPGERKDFDANLRTLERELKHLSGRLAGATAHLKGKELAASHPSFNYLARRFQLQIHNLALDPGTVPSDHDLAAFASWAKGKEPPVLLWEAEPTDAVKAAFPEEVVHLTLDPLEAPAGDTYDYVAQAEANASRLEDLLKPAED